MKGADDWWGGHLDWQVHCLAWGHRRWFGLKISPIFAFCSGDLLLHLGFVLSPIWNIKKNTVNLWRWNLTYAVIILWMGTSTTRFALYAFARSSYTHSIFCNPDRPSRPLSSPPPRGHSVESWQCWQRFITTTMRADHALCSKLLCQSQNTTL